MPFGAIVTLCFLLLAVNLPLRLLYRRVPFSGRLLPAWTAAELLPV